jgi:hypothetical protein
VLTTSVWPQAHPSAYILALLTSGGIARILPLAQQNAWHLRYLSKILHAHGRDSVLAFANKRKAETKKLTSKLPEKDRF